MPISSYVIRYRKEDKYQLFSRLCAMSGIRVGEIVNEGIPVAAETSSDAEARELGERLEKLPGVRSAVLVYHNFEDQTSETNFPGTL